jgi:hypothetical protein
MKRHLHAAIATGLGGKGGFRQKGKRREVPDPSQNLGAEKGAAVTLDEVLACRLQGHPACRGTGLGKDGRPCACATKRFFKAHPEIIVDAAGSAWHPVAKA